MQRHVEHQDRRRAGTVDRESAPPQLVAMIVGTYREMPGLCLHLDQAARLFGLGANACRAILDDLVRSGDLHR
ncbi:MAG TPA: hypothetical protein VH458_23440, partial [Vicinamibacterales bacterium]